MVKKNRSYKEQNQADIQAFLVDKKAQNHKIRQSTLDNYKGQLTNISEYIKKPFKEATKDDINGFLEAPSQRKRGKKDRYKNNVIVTLRCFYRFLYDCDVSDPLPKKCCIRSFKTTPIEETEEEKDAKIATEKEYQLLLNYATDPMWKAMIEAYRYFASRKSGIQDMLVGDVKYEDGFTKIIDRDKKTGHRPNSYEGRLVHLLNWSESLCPVRGIPNAPMFVIPVNGRGRPKKDSTMFVVNGISYKHVEKNYIADVLRRLSKQLGIRHIHQYMLRHMRITEMCGDKNYRPTDIQSLVGWKKNTQMLQWYDHNNVKNFEERRMKERGDRPIKPVYEVLEKQQTDIFKQQEERIKKLEQMMEQINEMEAKKFEMEQELKDRKASLTAQQQDYEWHQQMAHQWQDTRTREDRLRAFKAGSDAIIARMKASGASAKEIKAYRRNIDLGMKFF